MTLPPPLPPPPPRLCPRLEGTEEKFRNRESRPEDLQVIAELKDMVSERETLVKKLVVSGGALLGGWTMSSGWRIFFYDGLFEFCSQTFGADL